MKKIFVIASLAILAACNSNDNATTDAMEPGKDSTMQTINSPYPVAYSSSFAMDDAKNAENLLVLWKAWDNGSLAEQKDLFADSVEMHFSDGTVMHASRDSVVAAAQNVRDQYATATSTVNAIMPVKSTDRDENWALIWGKEVDTHKSGKIDSFYLQETWRFNKDGKADVMYQFKAEAKPSK